MRAVKIRVWHARYVITKHKISANDNDKFLACLWHRHNFMQSENKNPSVLLAALHNVTAENATHCSHHYGDGSHVMDFLLLILVLYHYEHQNQDINEKTYLARQCVRVLYETYSTFVLIRTLLHVCLNTHIHT